MPKKRIRRVDGVVQNYHVGKSATSNPDARAAFNRRPGSERQANTSTPSSRRLARAGILTGVLGTLIALAFIFPGGIASLLGILFSGVTIVFEVKVTIHYAKRTNAPAEDVDWLWLVIGAIVLAVLIFLRLTGVGYYS